MKKLFFTSILTAVILISPAAVLADTPVSPADIALSPSSPTSINISWSASSGATGYEIYRNNTTTPIATTTNTNYTDTGLQPATSYTYYMTAYDASSSKSALTSGISTTTLADTTKPSVPTNLSASVISTSQINLTWTASTDTIGVTGYRVYRNSVQIATTSNLSYSDTGLSASTSYAYTVAAYDAANNASDQTSEVTASTLTSDSSKPSVPTNLSASPVSPAQINLSWTASTDNVGVTGYRIYRESTLIATTPNTTYSDTGLNSSTTYNYYITSYDAANNVSDQTGNVSAATLVRTSDTPTLPTNLSASVISKSQINLTWSPASDDVAVTGYKIFRNGSQVTTTASTSYSDTGLAASTSYSYTVSAYDASSNDSGQSARVTSITQGNGSSVPTSPTNLIATPISATQVNLAWTAATDDLGITGYRIFRNGSQIATTTHVYYTDTGLTASTNYTYNVSAYDANDNSSGASGELTVSTLATGQTSAGNVTIKIINGDKRYKLINYRSNELINVAVFSGANFNARNIKNNTVLFGGAKPISWSIKDVNKDGKWDRVYSFRAKNLINLNGEDNIVLFTATTKDGKSIYATANVKVKSAPNKYRAALQKKIDALQKRIDDLKARMNNTNVQTGVQTRINTIKNNVKTEIKNVKQQTKVIFKDAKKIIKNVKATAKLEKKNGKR